METAVALPALTEKSVDANVKKVELALKEAINATILPQLKALDEYARSTEDPELLIKVIKLKLEFQGWTGAKAKKETVDPNANLPVFNIVIHSGRARALDPQTAEVVTDVECRLPDTPGFLVDAAINDDIGDMDDA